MQSNIYNNVLLKFYCFCRGQITYTDEITPKYLFDQTCLHLYTNVLNSKTSVLFDAIVGEASIKLGLEQLENVQDDSLSVQQRWKNLKGLVESRQGLYAINIILEFLWFVKCFNVNLLIFQI